MITIAGVWQILLVVTVSTCCVRAIGAQTGDEDRTGPLWQTTRTTNRTRRMVLSREETCALMPAILSVSPPPKYRHECETVKLTTLGCKGTCHSYSNLVTDHPYQIGRTCSCCEPLQMGIQLVSMRCKRGKMIRRPVRFPLSCSCRPCFHLNSGLQIEDIERLLTDAKT
ncbi:bursicon-like [Tubulanus polymorphus]|uniref:bursicon-like n=1 Tax=Tubulanus polymorphus TaxID=672921 RepID=UPI003DA692DB